MGSLTSPVFITTSQNIREMCPAERLSFTPSHPPFLTPPQHRTCSLLQGKQKKKKKSVRAVSFFLAPKIFAHSARTQRRRVTPKKGVLLATVTYTSEVRPNLPPTPPSALLEVVHANCLVNDTTKDRITWKADKCNRPENHHRHRPLETQWNTASALWLKVWPLSCKSCCLSYNAALKRQKLRPRLDSASKMLRENVAISIWTKSIQR